MTGLEPYSHQKKSSMTPLLGGIALIIVIGVLWISFGNNSGSLLGDTAPLHPATLNNTESVGAQPGPEMTAQENQGNADNSSNDMPDANPTPTDGSTQPGPSQETTDQPSTTPPEPETVPLTDDSKLFAAPKSDYSLSFCPRNENVSTQLLSNILPTDYIKKSSQKANLELWKELFLERNDITLDYFEKYIRISKAEMVEATSSSVAYFHVEYYLIVDWFNVPFTMDGFTVEDINGHIWTENQIKGLFSKSWGNPDKPMVVSNGNIVSYQYISDIRGNGSLLAKPVACMDVVHAFHSVDHDMIPVENQQNQGTHQLLVYGYVPSKLDNHNNLIDVNQNCPYGEFNVVTEQLQNVVYTSTCPVP